MNKETRDVIFSSETTSWGTPREFFDKLNKMYGPFTLDAAANETNAKVSKFYTEQNSGLLQSWENENVWINPPYGRNLTGPWVKKAWEECQKGRTRITMLLPGRIDTRWFHDYCLKAKEILFVKGRVKFEGAKHPAPFPSIIAHFDDPCYYCFTSFGVIKK